VLKGQALDDTHISCAGCTVRCSGGKFAPGTEGAVAVRQHVVRLWSKQPESMENVIPGTVVRQGFLGASRDYLVEMADRTQVRGVASAGENIPHGAAVWLYLPPDRCRVLGG